MIDRDTLDIMLYDKMSKELADFRTSLLKMTPADILSNYNPYELIYKEDLLMCFEDDEIALSDDELQLLNEMKTPLDWLYQKWCESSVSHMSLLREFIVDTVFYEKSSQAKE